MKEENEESSKSALAFLGLKQERGVVEGDAVESNHEAILKIILRHDKENRMRFYPATNKIVGAVATSKLANIRKDLSLIDKNIKISIRAQKLTPLKKE